jgi:signal transduction histidine kinase
VRLGYGPRELTVQVEDDGHGPPALAAPGTGKGVLGMRERVAALGGDLEAGPRPGGGFRVRARFPLEDGR